MPKGLIVYFDGPDGVGKTTQMELARHALEKDDRTIYETRTLGGTPIGEKLREVILSDSERPVETDLYVALAIQHALAPDILNRRDKGEIVLVDRSPLSIIAYQVHGDGLSEDLGKTYVNELLDLVHPDLILIYMADNNALMERRQARNLQTGHDHFEKMPADYHQRVTQGFAEAAKSFNGVTLDATDSVEAIHKVTMDAIASVLEA